MKLKDLLYKTEYDCIIGSTDIEITGICYDSRKVTPGCVFVCLRGAGFDGHNFAKEAIAEGAAALLVEDTEGLLQEKGVTLLKTGDTRYALAFISAAYFGHPAEKLQLIGVTGTKGKTTTTYLIKSILEQAGYKVGLIGTIEAVIGETHIPAENTTPESYVLQEYLSEMIAAGVEIVVMEASSQGLKLHRTQGFLFDYGIFTNLGEDHIGPAEHADMEEYIACKSLLFRQCRIGIINRDDKHWEDVTKGHTCSLETYGFHTEAMLRAINPRLTYTPGNPGVAFEVEGQMELSVEISAPGSFSVYNALAAIAICRQFGVEDFTIKRALKKARVKGRIEPVAVSDQFTVFIDYAHNAMSLESLLITLREYRPGRLISLFGCGGNRSRLRRYEMGEVSGRLADLTIITSDNPRYEKPQDIIEDIKMGIRKTRGSYVEICDRREAIAYAIRHGKPGDIIVLAGKGHEDYQEIKGIKYPMDERVIIQEILNNKG